MSRRYNIVNLATLTVQIKMFNSKIYYDKKLLFSFYNLIFRIQQICLIHDANTKQSLILQNSRGRATQDILSQRKMLGCKFSKLLKLKTLCAVQAGHEEAMSGTDIETGRKSRK